MNILYQNNQSGRTVELTELVTAAKWSTKRQGTPGKLELTVLASPEVEWTEGGIVALKQGERGLFYGYVFKITRSQEETVGILAYDQLRYLKNEETCVLEGIRADELLRRIAEEYRLKLGELPDTGYVIPSLVFDIKPLFDIILEALDRTLVQGGRMFYLWDDFGALRLSEVVLPKKLPVVGEGSLATGFTHERSIDGESYNKIKLVRDNKATGKRDVYIAEDSGHMKDWGILQRQEKVDEGLNAAQIQQRCEGLLALYNRPSQSLRLSALALPGLRAGEVIFVSLPGIGVQNAFLVEEADHDLMEETMDLQVKII